MSIDVIAQLKATDDLRRCKRRIAMKSKIKASIVGGCGHSMKDQKKKARNVHLLSLLHLSPSRFVSSEKRAGHVSAFERRKEDSSYRSCILLASRFRTLEAAQFSASYTAHIRAFIRRVKKKKKDAIGRTYAI